MCVDYILARIVLSPDREELTAGLMITNIKINIFPLISTIFIPTVLTLCYLAHIETLAVIYQNLYVALKCCIEK